MQVLKTLFQSKKFVVFLVGLIVSVLARMGLDEAVAKDIAMMVMGLASSYILGQGVADFGKEAEKIAGGE